MIIFIKYVNVTVTWHTWSPGQIQDVRECKTSP